MIRQILRLIWNSKEKWIYMGEFLKVTAKWTSFGVICDGFYVYGQLANEKASSFILSTTTKLWLYIFNFPLKEVIYSFLNNIAYYLSLPFNLVYYVFLLLFVLFIFFILKILLGIFNIKLLNILKTRNSHYVEIENILKDTKTKLDYDKEYFYILKKLYDDEIKKNENLTIENEELKAKKKKLNDKGK